MLRLPALTFVLSLLAPDGGAQWMPIARQAPGGTYAIWSVEESSGAATIALQGITFLSVDLTGYAAKDRLRADLPRLRTSPSAASCVLVPGGGAIYRVRSGTSSTALLHVRADGSPQLRATTPSGPGTDSILSTLHVSQDGSRALLATSEPAGGNVLLVDLLGSAPAVSLTSNQPPLAIDAESLRVSAHAAWFVANGVLHRADLSAGTQAQALDLGAPVLPELALSAQGNRVAAVIEQDESSRHIVVVPGSGGPIPVTVVDGDYDTPGLHEPLGPWLVLDEDGSLIAYRRTDPASGTQELYVEEVAAAAPEIHLTHDVDFPAYIDNVGVLGFRAPSILTFFAGDVQLSGVDASEMIGAADMYAVDFDAPGAPAVSNVTLTSHQSVPPFLYPGELAVAEALLDPQAERFLVVGETPEGDATLSSFPVDPSDAPGVTELLTALDGDPLLVANGTLVMVQSTPETAPVGPEGDLEVFDLHLLKPLSGGTGAFEYVTSVPDGITFDRFSQDRGGQYAAFVASAGPGFEVPVHALLPGGELALTWPDLFQISPDIAFSSSGALYLGLGFPGGPYLFARFTAPMVGQEVAIPVGNGFPLNH